ncbi:NUDIX domain-containing protein [Candidatus Daviesbacteria bacterium]|nr:NUDIX domain-containing protein [Candidatus Daviesbacteria bacterium]
MKREFSAGGIVFNSNRQVLVTQHSQNKHWSFPKGLLDHPEQTTEESALREVKEEGGVEAEIIGKVGYSKYVYTFKGEKIFKVVTYFLMKYVSGDIKDHDWEVSAIGWFEPEEALKKLTFNQDKELLKKAIEVMEVSS